MKAITIISLLLFLYLPGCSKVTSPTEPVLDVLGNWNWVESVGGFAGRTMTPKSEGFTLRLVFKFDNRSEFYRNDTLSASTKFTISRQVIGSDSVKVISYENNPYMYKSQYITVVHNDTLILQDLCMDCYRHTFTRIR